MARGSVLRRNGGWAFRIDAGLDPATGKRRQSMRQGFATKRDAEKALNEAVQNLDSGSGVPRSKLRLDEFLDDWLVSQKQRLRETTFHSYEVGVMRVKAHLGKVPLQAVTALQLEKFYADLADPADPAQRALAAKTVRNTHVVVRKAFGDAERLGLVVRNVAASARPPVAHRPEFETWSSDDLREFFAAASEERLFAAFVLSATTGMRRGEVLGLRWSDLDFDAGQLGVVQTLTTVNNRVIVSPPKTQRSRRTIFIDPQTIAVLREHRGQQRAARLLAGSAWNATNDLVFCDPVGDPVHPDVLSRDFVRVSKAAGLKAIRLHDLRHTYATLALKAGIHPKVVSERLGHATVGITLDLYSHVTPAIARDAADLVAAKIFAL